MVCTVDDRRVLRRPFEIDERRAVPVDQRPVEIALEEAVADVAQVSGYDLKRIMRTGTVATVDNRNWELRDQTGPDVVWL